MSRVHFERRVSEPKNYKFLKSSSQLLACGFLIYNQPFTELHYLIIFTLIDLKL